MDRVIMSKIAKAAAATLVAAVTAGCSTTDVEEMPQIGMPNPASVWCIEKGGRLEIVKDKDGNEVGMCRLPSGERIEEWALFRRDHRQ